MAKKRQKTKEAPPSLQNGAVDMPIEKAISIVNAWMEADDELHPPTEGTPDMATLIKMAIKKVLADRKQYKLKETPGQQLKLAATNTHDDLLEFIISSQAVAEKFYSSRTIKSGRQLRKIFLEISKRCLAERKVVLGAMGKKRQGHE